MFIREKKGSGGEKARGGQVFMVDIKELVIQGVLVGEIRGGVGQLEEGMKYVEGQVFII